ncbi:hypothetical protein [Zhongshania sp.]|uniref:hypothetical protein n=1 Tax=Zhongshania sp. TaxID=1971902 RepID=UPI003569A8CA
MAAKIVNRGLLRIGQQASQSTNYNVARYIRTMSVDDGTAAFAAAHTALNSGGAITNEYDQAFDATPTEASQTITHVCTIPTGQGNFTIRRIALHDDTAANVTTSSATLVAGVDGQSIGKTADFSLQITLTITYADAS